MTTKTLVKVKVIPFEYKHLVNIKLRAHEEKYIDKAQFAAYMHSEGAQAVTVVAGDEIIAITGFWVFGPGVLQVYVLPGADAPKYGIGFFRSVKRRLDALIESYKPDRAQTWSVADNQTDRWMKLLGFTKEGTHPKMFYGLTYRTWARYY